MIKFKNLWFRVFCIFNLFLLREAPKRGEFISNGRHRRLGEQITLTVHPGSATEITCVTCINLGPRIYLRPVTLCEKLEVSNFVT